MKVVSNIGIQERGEISIRGSHCGRVGKQKRNVLSGLAYVECISEYREYTQDGIDSGEVPLVGQRWET